MTSPIGGYTFLPWLRTGVANRIATSDGDASVQFRATIDVQLDIVGQKEDGSEFSEPIGRSVPLVGPGDIVGIDPRAIVRTDPRPWITNFESSHLAAIEFYDEDFPWRYTPAAPDTTRHRLRPWVSLVVLAEGEFTEERAVASRPLPAIRVPNAAVLPPMDELWAWAHVHVMRPLVPGSVVPSDTGTVLASLGATLRENADLACSRLLCPRRLSPDTGYHAFLVPSFERGRLAGLSADPDVAPHAMIGAWETYTGRPEPDRYPVYFRWYFRTGEIGDFEYLVRLLQPRPVDARVGTRDIDVLDPGVNLPPIDAPDLGGVLKLGGALRVPRSELSQQEREIADRYDNWATPFPHEFQRRLARFINLADTYDDKPAEDANLEAEILEDGDGDPDPLVTAPLYARWHSLTSRLLSNRDESEADDITNWVHDLNLDPRFRVAAGFGTRVVQDRQEELVHGAWEQVGAVLAANQRVRWAQLAHAASWRMYERHLRPLVATNADRAFSLSAPLHVRIVRGGVTLQHATRESVLPRAAVSAPLRRAARPVSRLTRSLPFTAAIARDALVSRVADGSVTAAPPKERPPGVVTVNDVTQAVESAIVPRWARSILSALPGAPTAVMVLAIMIAILAIASLGIVGWLVALMAVGAGIALRSRLSAHSGSLRAVHAVAEDGLTVETVDALPTAPDFRLDETSAPSTPAAPTSARDGVDSPDAVRLKRAMRDVALATDTGRRIAPETPRATFDTRAAAQTAIAALDPSITIATRTWRTIRLPDRLLPPDERPLSEVMAYPEFDLAMYRPLVDISAELFLPNLNLIPPNSITLLETNQRFIESYMVGLNHEFARELLWREYPTDSRGSYFRQFWDVSGYVDTFGRTPEQLREDLRDIPPIHTWPRDSELGAHDQREQQPGASEEEVVLVIRGELLKRYPNAVIYAHRAEWPRVGNVPTGAIDRTRQRDLVDLTDAESQSPPPHKARFPLYEAKVDPDIYFFGFDLTVDAVKGESGDNDTDDPGWFFVIKERPGEPRFGLDDGPASLPGDEKPQVWNELTWGDAGVAPGGVIRVAALPTIALKPIPTSSSDDDKKTQRTEDLAVPFSASTNAADLAYVLFQAPVLVAVHGAEMLRKRSPA